jgi:hypothetical protein
VVAAAGSGLQTGLHTLQQQRRDTPGRRPLESGLDLFHIKQEGQRVLRPLWAAVERAWRKAKQADQTRAAKRWHGDKWPAQHAAHAASRAWRKLAKVFGAYERQEAAWRRLETAFELYRPDGQLNERAWAEGEIAQAKTALGGAVWSKGRRFVNEPRCLTFLDRLARDLGRVERRPEVCAALVELWRLRHGGPRGRGPQCGRGRESQGVGPGRRLPWPGQELASEVSPGVGGAEPSGPGEQRGGVPEQWGAHAPGASPHLEPPVA